MTLVLYTLILMAGAAGVLLVVDIPYEADLQRFVMTTGLILSVVGVLAAYLSRS